MIRSPSGKRILFSAVVVTMVAASMFGGSSIVGTYSNANGVVTLDVRSARDCPRKS